MVQKVAQGRPSPEAGYRVSTCWPGRDARLSTARWPSQWLSSNRPTGHTDSEPKQVAAGRSFLRQNGGGSVLVRAPLFRMPEPRVEMIKLPEPRTVRSYPPS